MVGPIFTVFSILFIVITLVAKWIKKQTNAIPSIVAFVSVMEVFALLF